MTLIKSISGIRGTIGGAPGESLTPIDVVKFTYAYCEKMKERRPKADDERYKVVVGKDARLAAPLIHQPFTSAELGVLMPKGSEDLLSTP